MQEVLILSLGAGLVFSLAALFDKFALENKMANGHAYFFLQLTTAMIFFPILSTLIFGFEIPSLPAAILIFLSTIAANIGFWLYFSLVRDYDLSSIGPLTQTKLLFTIPLAFFVLKEFYGYEAIILMGLILVGAIFTTYSKSFSLKALLLDNRLLFLALIMGVSWALSDLPVKMVAGEISSSSFITWRYLFSVPVLLVFGFFMFKGKTKKTFFKDLKKTLPFSLTSTIFVFTGTFLLFTSYALSYTITSALVLSQAIFVFIIAFVISKVKSRLIDERHSNKVYLVRLAGVLLIISSIYFLMNGNLVL